MRSQIFQIQVLYAQHMLEGMELHRQLGSSLSDNAYFARVINFTCYPFPSVLLICYFLT